MDEEKMAHEMALWVGYIYNLRGYEMTPDVWDKFKAWCERNRPTLTHDTRFEVLP